MNFAVDFMGSISVLDDCCSVKYNEVKDEDKA